MRVVFTCMQGPCAYYVCICISAHTQSTSFVYICMCLHIYNFKRYSVWFLLLFTCIPVVPHKAVAEVSKIGNYRTIGEVRCCDAWMAEQIR